MNAFHCPHLQPYLDELLADGASIAHTETSWSNCRANVVVTRGPSIVAANARWTFPAGVQLWANDDGHYSLENGLSCPQCQMGISWPRPERQAG